MESERAMGIWRFADREVRESTRELLIGGEPVSIERKPFETLLCLLAHAGEVVTRMELTEQVWPERIISESVLSRTILKLRKALLDDRHELIKTVHGYGYRLTAPVEWIPESSKTASRFDLRPGFCVPQRPHYILKEQLGTGGYGEVWLAQHTKTSEFRVFKFCVDEKELFALKREVTVYRLLNESLGRRQDLVHILDWEFAEAPFFIEVEHVAGGTLTYYMQSRGGAAEVPLDQRIELVAQIAETVAAAHSVGVLHKDIKPPNILIADDGDGRIRTILSDFGSGYLLDPERLGQLGITRAGFTRQPGEGELTSGTPLYLAPELIAGQAPCIQSDVYALGILLYQIVCGDFGRPIAPGWEADIDDELLRRDIARAANIEVTRRFGSATELAERLRSLPGRRRALEAKRQSEQLAQRQATALQQARIRRRWLGGLVVVLALGLGFSTYLFLESRSAWQEAERQAETLAALSGFLTEDLLAAADPFQSPDAQMTVREAVDRASGDLEVRFGDSPHQEATIRRALGRIYTGLGDVRTARDQFRKAVDLYAGAQAANSAEALEALAGLGRMSVHLDEFEEARRLLKAGLNSSLNHLGEASPQTLWFRAYLAWLAYREGQHEAAISEFATLLDEFQSEQEPPPDLIDFVIEWSMLANAYQGRLESVYEMAQALAKHRLARHGPTHPATQWANRYLGATYREMGRYEEAEALLTNSLNTMRANLPEGHTDLINGVYELAVLYIRIGRHEAAVPLLAEVLEAKTREYGPDHQEVHYALNALAHSHVEAGLVSEGIGFYQQLLPSAIRVFGQQHPDVIIYRANLASAYLAADNLDQADSILEAVLADSEGVFGADHFRIGMFRTLLGRIRVAQGRIDEAQYELDSALRILVAVLGEDHARVQLVRELITELENAPVSGS